MPARIFARDQHRQLEGVCEVERRKLLCGRLDDEQVPVLECLAEDRIGAALRGRRSSSSGPRRHRESIQQHVLPEQRVVRRGRRVFVAIAELERWLEANAARTFETDS
jgi:hypothetical protein